MNIYEDSRTVLTLDAGGTNFVFSAICAGREVVAPIRLDAYPNDLERSLASITEGFRQVQAQLTGPASAISFAFPGPADYPNGIIWNVGNLPAFKEGVALGPMLSDRFGLPCFINNDGDLYAYGEAISGFLPAVNKELEAAGSSRRYKNLIGLTLGTGFGAGLVSDGRLLLGDNSMATEVWLMRSFLSPARNVEEGISIRAVRKAYADVAGIPLEEVPEPKEIYAIGQGQAPGNRVAALQAFHLLGVELGEAIATLMNIADALMVIGGGLAGACSLFFPSMLAQLRSRYTIDGHAKFPRTVQKIYNLEDSGERVDFLKGTPHTIQVPGSGRTVSYDPEPKIGIGLSFLGTSKAIALGAYAYALGQLD